MSKDERSVHLAIVEKISGRHIGTMGFHNIDWIHRRATTGTLIGEKEYWSKGFGKDAKMTLLNYVFRTLNLRKICSSALATNERSMRYNMACGYREVGRRREQFFVHGAWVDEVLLEVFYEEWLALWEKYCVSEKR